MSRRVASVLAWSLFGLFALSAAATLALVASGSGGTDESLVVLSFGFATVGALVASRAPANAVGWLLLAIGVSFGVQEVAATYIRIAGRPGETAIAWFSSWSWYLWLYLAGLILPLVFPTGRLLSDRWRVVLWAGIAAFPLSIAGTGLRAGPLEADTPEPILNPVGVEGPLPDLADLAANLLAVIVFVLGVVCLTMRLRRSRGRERQQVKLFVYVGSLAIAGLLVAMVDVLAGASAPWWVHVMGGVGWTVASLLIVVGLPIAVGVAILRHRLYDIDLVIKRTLVYGSLTAVLAATYLGLVLVLQPVLSPVTGQSDLAVAGSTLAVAALFRPARSRIQSIVDRRFFRARYDAARTMETFTGRLRDDLDLEALGGDLRRVVADTMQPAHVSLWLRGAP